VGRVEFGARARNSPPSKDKRVRRRRAGS